jgi:hypothetical protein
LIFRNGVHVFDSSLSPPSIQSQDDEADNGPPSPPLVTHLFQVSQTAIGSLHVIVGPHPSGFGTVEERHHLVEFLGAEHCQRPSQVGIGQILRVFDQSRAAARRLMGTLFWVEQTVDLKHKIPQHPRLGQVAKDLAEPAAFSPIEVFGSGHDQVAMFPDEVRLFLLGVPSAGSGSLLLLTWSPTASLGTAFLIELTSKPSKGVKDTVIDILDDVEDAELMASIRQQFSQESWVQV